MSLGVGGHVRIIWVSEKKNLLRFVNGIVIKFYSLQDIYKKKENPFAS